MSARADRYTSRPKVETRSDVAVGFMLNPVTSSISRVVDDAAIAQAIRLTILTFNGEWPFEPDNGSAVSRSVFEPSDPVSMDVLRTTIEQAVQNRCRGYARVVQVLAGPGQDPRVVNVVVAYQAVGSSTVSTVSVLLRRVR